MGSQKLEFKSIISTNLPQSAPIEFKPHFFAITAIIVFLMLSGCVSSNPNALQISNQNNPQTISRPQLAVLAGDPALTQNQPDEELAALGQQSGIAAPNTPLRSPLKRALIPVPSPQSAQIVQAPDANQLAISSPTTDAGSVVQQVVPAAATLDSNTPSPTARPVIAAGAGLTGNASVTPSTTTQLAQPGESVGTTPASGTENGAPTVLAALPSTETEVKKPNLLQRLFGGRKTTSATNSSNLRERFNATQSKTRQRQLAHLDEDAIGNRFAARPAKSKREIKTISRKQSELASLSAPQTTNALPGVKSNNEIFGIKQDKQANGNQQNTQVASLGNLGRLSPNGLRLQHDKVQVACLKPGVLALIKQVERHYGKKPIITSGYRSPKRNRRAGGARNSQHVFCKAVDMQVEGVSKWQLAKYLRTLPGRGGVGTYCRTKSVHIDIGSKRDWHHKCRRSSKKKRKKA